MMMVNCGLQGQLKTGESVNSKLGKGFTYNPCLYSVKIIHWENSYFNKKCWEYTHYLKTHIKKIKSKMDQRPEIRAKMVQLLQESMGEKLYNIGFGNDFLNMAKRLYINWTISKCKICIEGHN
jgi:hypothetical protein